MILDSYNEIPYYSCNSAMIRPKNKKEYTGKFAVGSESFTVKIISSYDDGEPIPRVWARIKLVDSVPGACIDDYACSIAAKSQIDPSFIPVKVDLRDGETAYMKTWTYDYPNDEVMDAFIKQSIAFIEAHLHELRSMSSPTSTTGLEDLLDLF